MHPSPDDPGSMRARLRALLPHRKTLEAHPMLGRLGERLSDHGLWDTRSEGMARGAAIGLFWAFLLPVAQILIAAAHCVWWRGNIPMAAAATLVTNPFTIGFWLYLAYQVGAAVTGAPPIAMPGDDTDWMAWLGAVGAPAVLGMVVFSLVGAVLGYVGVKLVWKVRSLMQAAADKRG